MRTTLTLDPDVARLVEDAVHRQRRPMKQVINDALRRALQKPAEPREPYAADVHYSALQPGLDLAGFNRLSDQIEDAAVMATASKPT